MTTQEPPPDPDNSSPTHGLPSYGSFDPPPENATPPPPGGGYQPPVGEPKPFSATDAIGYGWKKFSENVGPILIATFILIAVSIVFSLIDNSVTGESRGSGWMNLSLGGVFFQVLSTVVGYILGAAIIRGALDVTEGKKFNLAEAFSTLPYGNVIITSLLIAVLQVIGFFLLILPGILVAFLTIFALYFVVDKNQSPIEAITSSAKLVRAHIGDTLLLLVLSIVVIIAGVVAICVGLLVAVPVVILATAYAYKKFLGEPVAA